MNERMNFINVSDKDLAEGVLGRDIISVEQIQKGYGWNIRADWILPVWNLIKYPSSSKKGGGPSVNRGHLTKRTEVLWFPRMKEVAERCRIFTFGQFVICRGPYGNRRHLTKRMEVLCFSRMKDVGESCWILGVVNLLLNLGVQCTGV